MSAQDIASTGIRAWTGDSGCPSACSRHRPSAAPATWTVPGTELPLGHEHEERQPLVEQPGQPPVVVAALAETGDDVVAALARYQEARREATGRIILANRGNGPEQVMQLAHERAPDGFDDIDAVIPRAELEEIAARYKRLAGFAPEQVNRPA